jgi:hypothetical protein
MVASLDPNSVFANSGDAPKPIYVGEAHKVIARMVAGLLRAYWHIGISGRIGRSIALPTRVKHGAMLPGLGGTLRGLKLSLKFFAGHGCTRLLLRCIVRARVLIGRPNATNLAFILGRQTSFARQSQLIFQRVQRRFGVPLAREFEVEAVPGDHLAIMTPNFEAPAVVLSRYAREASRD